MYHWHITRHSDDDDPFVTTDLYAAMEYIRQELDDMADFEHQGISAAGDSGDFEGAYRAFQRCETYSNLQANASNIVRQHQAITGNDVTRHALDGPAPLYAGPDGASRLLESALHVAEMVESDSPMHIWHCTSDTDNPEWSCYTATHDAETGETFESDMQYIPTALLIKYHF